MYYVGEFKNGWHHGYGTLKYDTPCVDFKYTGQFVDGDVHGFGKLTNKMDGLSYVGDFRHGLKDGYGIEIDTINSRTYYGNWKNNQKHGKGFEDMNNLGTYEGVFVDGYRNGLGIF